MKRLIALLPLLFFLFSPGQSPSTTDSLISIYYKQQGLTLPIFSGRKYYGYGANIEGNPYYFYPDWQTGSVLYEGVRYNNLSVQYDIYQDQVLVTNSIGLPFNLYSERVEEFSLPNMTFVRLRPDKNHDLKEGFYQKLVDGKLTVYARRVKILDEKVDVTGIERKFIASNVYYVQKDGKYYVIRNKRSIYNLLDDNRSKINDFLSERNIRYKTDPETTLIQIAQLYNQLSK
jgi:hypothetical protein